MIIFKMLCFHCGSDSLYFCSPEPGYRSCKDVEADVELVDEEWVWACLDETTSSAANAFRTSKKRASDSVVIDYIESYDETVESDDETVESDDETEVEEENEYEYDEKVEEEEKDRPEGTKSNGEALKGFIFAIGDILSVPTAEFRKLIKENGGSLVTFAHLCTHLVTADAATIEEREGYHVVSESWVRSKIPIGPAAADGSFQLPRQSFVPLFDFIEELINTDEFEGSLDLRNQSRYNPPTSFAKQFFTRISLL
jgi:hypothetical protein